MKNVIAKNVLFKPLFCLAIGRRTPVKYISGLAASNKPKSFNIVDTAKANPTKFSPSVRRNIDKIKQIKTGDDKSWSVIAYNLSEELEIEKVQKLLDNLDNYLLSPLPNDIKDDAVMLSSKLRNTHQDNNSNECPLNDIFLFREGSVVFWGVPFEQQRRVLYSLASLKVNPIPSELIQEEKEHINYALTNQSDKSRLDGDVIQISTCQDIHTQRLDQLAFSHAVALSVKLGIWEMILDEYIDSVEWITENMKHGKEIKLSKDQVFRKTGEILCLKHSINLSSDLLDLPDIYWDRNNQEAIFSSLFAYLNIRKRTNVINEKLNNCCELMNLLASHMNDRHHIRLEWMIIVLITVEVAFEFIRFYGLDESAKK